MEKTFRKIQGKPGLVRDFSTVSIQVRENSWKTNCLSAEHYHQVVHNLQNVVVPLIVSKCKLYHFA